MGDVLKWLLILLAGWFVIRWLSGAYANGANPSGDGELLQGYWAAPLSGPGPVFGWAPPNGWRGDFGFGPNGRVSGFFGNGNIGGFFGN